MSTTLNQAGRAVRQAAHRGGELPCGHRPRYQLEQAADTVRYVETRQKTGNVVLTITGSQAPDTKPPRRHGRTQPGVDEFCEHRKAAFDALSGLSARYEPIAGDGQRLAARATVTGVHRGEFFGVAATGKRLSWREVHQFEVRDGRIAEHWMDAALLSAYLQMTGQGEPDAEPPRAVPSGLSRRYTAAEQRAPLDAYTAMVAGHDASAAQKLYTDGGQRSSAERLV